MPEQETETNLPGWNKNDTAVLVLTLVGILMAGTAIDRKEIMPFLGSLLILTVSFNYLLQRIDS